MSTAQVTAAAEKASGRRYCQYCRVFLPLIRFDRHRNRRRCDSCIRNKVEYERQIKSRG